MKSHGAKSCSYAKGGEVLGRTKDFMKVPDKFRDSQFTKKTSEDYGDGNTGIGPGKVTAPAVKDKSLKAVKPKG